MCSTLSPVLSRSDYGCGRLPAAAVSVVSIVHKRMVKAQRLLLAKELSRDAGACNLSPSPRCVVTTAVSPRVEDGSAAVQQLVYSIHYTHCLFLA